MPGKGGNEHLQVEAKSDQNGQEEHTTTTKDKDGKETSHTSTKQSSTSSSSSSYSHFSNVFKYVISGNSEASNNAAPFQNGHVQWTRSPTGAADFAVSQAINSPIARPARAETCNRRFPFTERQHTADDQDSRFAQPFPAEALDPVSKIALDLHNVERARYGLHPLQWNTELANMAACWADLKAYGHSEDHFCASGENIAMGLGDPCYSDPMEGMKNAIYSFLDEDRDWAKTRQMGSSTGHWVQAVWKDTRFLGCAVAQRKDFMQGYNDNDQASMYVVCEYYPPGNVLNQIRDQVPAVVRPTPQLRSSCSANERHS
uniref:SCP domain-containing protein n=1 Tax=Kalmanozyma brasiliensis (strain GHG001) TaxID=1365824 RepID=V5EZG5_KALBG